MDLLKTGKLISEARKNKNLTQKDLASKLSISDKAISKWERGLCFPDISLLIPLSEILDISLYELLSGEKIEKEKVDDTLKNTINYTNHIIKKNKKRSFLIYFILGILCLAMLLKLIVLLIDENNKKKIIPNLWETHEKRMDNIKENMDEITVTDKNHRWIKLKDIDIKSQEYLEELNNLVVDINECYMEYNRIGEKYQDKSKILDYYNKNKVSNRELEIIRSEEDTCITRFQKYDNFIKENNHIDTNGNVWYFVDMMNGLNKEYQEKPKKSTLTELVVLRLSKVSQIERISRELNKEYKWLSEEKNKIKKDYSNIE